MSLKIGILKEPVYENRISLLPEQVISLIKKGITVYVEKGAGVKAFASDEAYVAAGALMAERSSVISESDALLAIHSF